MADSEPVQRLAQALARSDHGWFNRWPYGSSCLLVGTLIIGRNLVPPMGVLCSIEATADWPNLIPKFRCLEPWMRHGNIDWHCYDDLSLCLDVHDRWRDALAGVAAKHSPTELARYAAEYLLNSAAALITYHRFGHEHALVDWPSAWPFWAHGSRGERDYLKNRYVCT